MFVFVFVVGLFVVAGLFAVVGLFVVFGFVGYFNKLEFVCGGFSLGLFIVDVVVDLVGSFEIGLVEFYTVVGGLLIDEFVRLLLVVGGLLFVLSVGLLFAVVLLGGLVVVGLLSKEFGLLFVVVVIGYFLG